MRLGQLCSLGPPLLLLLPPVTSHTQQADYLSLNSSSATYPLWDPGQVTESLGASSSGKDKPGDGVRGTGTQNGKAPSPVPDNRGNT